MQGYGKEVYITESDDISYVKINGKEYELETSDYYDEETGDNSYNFDLKDKKGKTVYSFSEYSNLYDFGKKCEQNIFIVDEKFLKELKQFSNQELPTQKEVIAEELKQKLDDKLPAFPFENSEKNEKDFKFKEELNKEKEKVFEMFRKNQEELVSYGISDTLNIDIENLNKKSPYIFSDEEIEVFHKNYLEKNNLSNDEEYIDKIYNKYYIEKYKPLSIIDEYPEIKAEVLERLPFDFGDVLPPFQVYNSNEMFYDSGTQEKSENLDNFMRSLVGDMAWDSMDIDNIMEWRKVSEDFPNVFNIIYFEKNNKGEFDDNSIKDFNSYDDYVDYSEKAIKEKLEDMLKHNPSLYKKIEENVIATQKEAGVYKEKTFEKEIKEKDELELKEDKEIDFS